MQLAILGGGVMGDVLARSVTENGVFAPSEVAVLDHNPDKLAKLAADTGVQTTSRLEDISTARMLLLAIKPDNVSDILAQLGQLPLHPERVLISIVAGAPLTLLSSYFPPDTAAIRVMTNTPCLVRQGMSVLAPNASVSPEQLAEARAIFDAVGQSLILPEKYLDAVTGLSGSGPGFFFLIVDAMIEAGVLQGLPRAVARQLVLQTMSGSAQLMQETAGHPAQLRDMVTSPGGTTIAGIQVMEEYKMRATLLKTVETATRRSRELGQKSRDGQR
ncbi:MAG: pyrroline-5-carboxylate reductase [Candidatus Sericytochromatia bacterium]